jgi:hypothetical protein
MTVIADADLYTSAGMLQFQALCEASEACADSADYRAYAIGEGWTLHDLIYNAPSFDPVNAAGWGYWCRTDMSADLGPAIRLAFADVGTSGENGPRMAAQLCIDLTNLGDDETLMLLTKWHGDYRPDMWHEFPNLELAWAEKIGDA